MVRSLLLSSVLSILLASPATSRSTPEPDPLLEFERSVRRLVTEYTYDPSWTRGPFPLDDPPRQPSLSSEYTQFLPLLFHEAGHRSSDPYAPVDGHLTWADGRFALVHFEYPDGGSFSETGVVLFDHRTRHFGAPFWSYTGTVHSVVARLIGSRVIQLGTEHSPWDPVVTSFVLDPNGLRPIALGSGQATLREAVAGHWSSLPPEGRLDPDPRIDIQRTVGWSVLDARLERELPSSLELGLEMTLSEEVSGSRAGFQPRRFRATFEPVRVRLRFDLEEPWRGADP